MGCFLGCFGGAKDQRRRKQRINRERPRRQRSHVQNIQQESVISAEQTSTEATPLNLDSELRNKPEEVKGLSVSPKKRVTFNSNITTYEHVPVHESIESLPDCAINIEKEKHDDLNTSCQSYSNSKDDNSVISSAVLYPPNHRYHNTRESDDEAEYGDSDLDDLDDTDDEDYYDDDDDVDVDVRTAGQEVWSESVVTESLESRTGNHSEQAINEGVQSATPPGREVKGFTSKTNARDRSDYINSVLNPVENITQWKAAKSKGSHLLKPQKENLTANFDAPRPSFSSEPALGQPPSRFKSKADQLKKPNQEIAVDTSLSNWLATPKKSNFSGLETVISGQTMSEGHTSFEDRPILGALTVEELKQISPSPSPRKSPSQSPDDMPIIGTVGTYWNHLGSAKHFDSSYLYMGTPNATNKCRG